MEKRDWVVYAKPPFGGPEQVLQYLGRYTPCRHLQSTSARARRRASLVPVERLPRAGQTTTIQNPHHLRRGVHSPLSPPHPAARFSAHPLLRVPRESFPPRETRPLPPTPARNPQSSTALRHGLPGASGNTGGAVPAALPEMPTRPYAAHSGSARLSLAGYPTSGFLMNQLPAPSPDCQNGRAPGYPRPKCLCPPAGRRSFPSLVTSPFSRPLSIRLLPAWRQPFRSPSPAFKTHKLAPQNPLAL